MYTFMNRQDENISSHFTFNIQINIKQISMTHALILIFSFNKTQIAGEMTF